MSKQRLHVIPIPLKFDVTHVSITNRIKTFFLFKQYIFKVQESEIKWNPNGGRTHNYTLIRSPQTKIIRWRYTTLQTHTNIKGKS